MSTHAHYAGEFGSQRMTKKLEKDPAYRAARAEYFAREAHAASVAHASATTSASRSMHVTVIAHAESRAASHAKAAEKLAPGSEHAKYAREAHQSVKESHEAIKKRESSSDPDNVKTTKMPIMSNAELAQHLAKKNASMSPTPVQQSVGPTPASTVTTTPIPVIKADKLSSVATMVSAIATVRSSEASHVDAAKAHLAAASAHIKSGSTGAKALFHENEVKRHLDEASKEKAASKPQIEDSGKWTSSGAVVVNGEGKIAVVRPAGQYGGHKWILPKGRVDAGESLHQAAHREVLEEAGVRGELGQHLGTYEGSHSTTHFFLMKHTSDDVNKMDKETAEVRFVTHQEAKTMLTHPMNQEALRDAVKVLKEHESVHGAPFHEGAHVRPEEHQFTKTTRPAGGSQGGSWYKDAHGGEWFGKHYEGHQDRLHNEHVTNQIYRKLGVSAPETKIVTVNGKAVMMSKEIKGQVANSAAAINATDMQKHFVHDAWLANHDVVGLVHDNVIVHEGKAHRIDNGGSTIYRAMGAEKKFGAPVEELQSMRNPKYAAGQVFGKLTDKDVHRQVGEFIKSYDQHKSEIHDIVDKSGLSPESKAKIQTGLHERAEWLRQYHAKGL